MNQPSSSTSENITIITRMRGSDQKSKYSKLKILENLNINISQLLENFTKTQESKQQKSAIKLKDDIRYTMFTSGDSSNIMLVSQKPIKGSTINEALKVCDNLYEFHNSILNEASLLEYDKIYNETHSIERIYNDNIKDKISQLFHEKNSCILCFGPSSSGKSFLLFGDSTENNNNINNTKNKQQKNIKNQKDNIGLIKNSIYTILNLIKISKQGNDSSSNVKNKYELRISIYQIYFDKIFDLLSSDIKKIPLQKIYDENNQIFDIKLKGLTDIEIRNIQDYDKIIKEVEINKKNLVRKFKVKDINKNSDLIVSLKLRKKIQNRVGNNIIDNYSANYFSQIDFVELISSEVGISDKFQDNNDLSYEYTLYENTKNVYDSLIDNITSANYGINPNKDSMLTLSLKNTLKTNSNIVFFNCIIPWEYPINNSYNALKFTTWLRNQVINEGDNYTINNNTKNNENFINNNLFNTMNENNNIMNIPNVNNSYYKNNYKNPITEDNNNINNSNFNMNKSFQLINNSVTKSQSFNNEMNDDEENKIKLMRNHSSKFNIHQNLNKSYDISNKRNRNNMSQIPDNNLMNRTQYINPKENLSLNEKTIQTLEQTLNELENKKLEIQTKILEDKNNMNNNEEMVANNNFNNFVLGRNKIMSPEMMRIKEEQDILKSDNIIMKEDINHLTELNQNLENEVAQNRETILQLKSDNQKLLEENNKIKSILNDYDSNNYMQLCLNGQITKDEFLQKYFDEKYFLTNKLKETQKNYEILQNEKTKYEVEYKILVTKYQEIQNRLEKCNYDMINNRQIHENELFNIDNKINELSKEVEKLQIENYDLRRELETQRNSLSNTTKERDFMKEKYEQQKYENDILNKKIFDVEKGYSDLLRQKENDNYYQFQKVEENNRNKNETKNKIAEELHSKIQKYRRERLQNKNNEE